MTNVAFRIGPLGYLTVTRSTPIPQTTARAMSRVFETWQPRYKEGLDAECSAKNKGKRDLPLSQRKRDITGFAEPVAKGGAPDRASLLAVSLSGPIPLSIAFPLLSTFIKADLPPRSHTLPKLLKVLRDPLAAIDHVPPRRTHPEKPSQASERFTEGSTTQVQTSQLREQGQSGNVSWSDIASLTWLLSSVCSMVWSPFLPCERNSTITQDHHLPPLLLPRSHHYYHSHPYRSMV